MNKKHRENERVQQGNPHIQSGSSQRNTPDLKDKKRSAKDGREERSAEQNFQQRKRPGRRWEAGGEGSLIRTGRAGRMCGRVRLRRKPEADLAWPGRAC